MAGMFRPFDTPAMYDGDVRAWTRFVVSFVLINVAPLGYFVLVYRWLYLIDLGDGSNLPFRAVFILFIMSIAGFGFWRIFFGTMLIKYRRNYVFYGLNLPSTLDDELKKRSARQREFLPHLVPGLIWIAATLAVAYCWSHGLFIFK